VRLDRSVSVGHVDAVLSCVEAGLGVSILPRSCVASRLPSRRLSVRSLAPQSPLLSWKALLRQTEAETSPTAAVAADLADWCRAGFQRKLDRKGRRPES
jgi:DNA-binding transcriptional LysR family regulator